MQLAPPRARPIPRIEARPDGKVARLIGGMIHFAAGERATLPLATPQYEHLAT